MSINKDGLKCNVLKFPVTTLLVLHTECWIIAYLSVWNSIARMHLITILWLTIFLWKTIYTYLAMFSFPGQFFSSVWYMDKRNKVIFQLFLTNSRRRMIGAFPVQRNLLSLTGETQVSSKQYHVFPSSWDFIFAQ